MTECALSQTNALSQENRHLKHKVRLLRQKVKSAHKKDLLNYQQGCDNTKALLDKQLEVSLKAELLCLNDLKQLQNLQKSMSRSTEEQSEQRHRHLQNSIHFQSAENEKLRKQVKLNELKINNYHREKQFEKQVQDIVQQKRIIQ